MFLNQVNLQLENAISEIKIHKIGLTEEWRLQAKGWEI
jgi:hypothetical protein